MNNYNIRQDRPRLSSEEIAQRKDFDSLLNNYQIMKKPFYKSPWFFGITGMATVGLLIGTSYSFTDSPSELTESADIAENVPPPEEKPKTIYLASMETPLESTSKETIPEKTTEIQLKKKKTYDKTSTLNDEPQKELISQNDTQEEPALKPVSRLGEETPATNSIGLANHPRILGKIGGAMSINDIDEGLSISTDSKIPIASFELHITTEFGAKVFASQSGQLTSEMVRALKQNYINNEVYFENIRGQIGSDRTIALQPLKYTLVK